MPRDGATLVSRRVEVIEDTARFAALRSPWTRLLGKSLADSPFLTWEWLYPWWTHLHGGRTLHLLTVRQCDELIGIAPLARVGAPLPWLSRLEFLGTGYAGSDYLDLILHRDYETEALDEIAKTLSAEGSALHLDHVPIASAASRLLRPVGASGWTSMTSASGTCPVVSLAGHTWDSYLASIGSAHRANFRRRLRGLSRQFDVRFDRVSTETERGLLNSPRPAPRVPMTCTLLKKRLWIGVMVEDFSEQPVKTRTPLQKNTFLH